MSGTTLKMRSTQLATSVQASQSATAADVEQASPFAANMAKMQEHYLGGATTLYPLPLSLLVAANGGKLAVTNDMPEGRVGPTGTVTSLSGRPVQNQTIDYAGIRTMRSFAPMPPA